MKRSLWQRVCALVVAMLMIVSLVPPLEVNAVGEWCPIMLKQRGIDHWRGCTVCTLQLMLQNSQTLKPEYQLSSSVTSSRYNDGSQYDKFNQACADNIAAGYGTNYDTGTDLDGRRHVSDSVDPTGMPAAARKMCKDGVTWQFLANESSVDGKGTESKGSNYVVGIGGRDFKSMEYSELVSTMKLFWNAGYWVAIGLVYTSGGSQLGPGPSGYKSDHWVMLAGVDDNDIYINDPAYCSVATFRSHTNYSKVVHLALFKNSYKSPMELSSGGRVDFSSQDYSNLNGMGVSQGTVDAINTQSPSINLSLSDDVLLSNCRLQEMNLESLYSGADVDNLLQNDLEVLEGWRTNIEGNKKEFGFIAVLRWIVSMVGILITLWAIFIYLAFWFDHVNSFVYLDLLHILTLGQLHICSPGEKPTFSLGKDVKNKTVSHWQILCICITAIVFGATLISGLFYNAVTALVRFIQGFIA